MVRGCLVIACVLFSAVATAAGQCPLAPGDDLTLMFDQSAYTVEEGGVVDVVVQLCGSITDDVVVTFTTYDGTAEAGNDYTSVSMDLTFSATITSQTVMIMTSTDNVLEDDEEFTLSLTTGDSAVTVTTPSATVTLTDETTVMIGFEQAQYTVAEGEMTEVTVSVISGFLLEKDVMATVITDGTGTVESGSDYPSAPIPLTIGAGTTSQTVMIMASTDSIVETQEMFTLSLTTSDAAVMPQFSTSTVAIIDTTEVMIDFNQPDYSVNEGVSVMAEVQVMSGITLDRDVVVTVQTVDGSGTAEAGSDYMSETVDLIFSAGTTNQTVMIMTSTDSIVEDMETFTLSLTSNDPAVMPQSVSTTVSITDMTMVTIGLDSMMYSVTEGGSVTATVSVMSDDVTLDRDVVVTVMTSDGTADSADFMVAPLALTFNSDTLSQDVMVTALPDTVSEGDEDFSLSLTEDDTAVQLNVSTATVTITDATVALGFSQPSYTFTEGQMMADVVVTVTDNPLSRSVLLAIMSVESGDAVGGRDFTEVDLQVTLTSTFTLSLSILEDRDVENDETFSLSLTTDDMGVNIMTDSTVITITDATIHIGLNMMSYQVAEGGSVDVTVAVSGSLTVTGNVMVTLTADFSTDINFQSEVLTFSSSEMSRTITISAMTDDMVEGEETVILTLNTSAVNVALSPALAELVIMDETVIVLENPQSQAVLVGEPVDMTCVIGTGFDIIIMWSKDDVIVNDSSITITTIPPSGGVGSYSSVLSISSVTLENCGTYMCSAIGVDSNTADLSVVALVDTSDPSPMSSVGAVGMLSCTIRRCGDFSIFWDIILDDGTELPFPVDVTTLPISDTVDELTSVVTINTLGVINRGRTQQCVVQYNGTNVTYQVFDYTLENVKVNVAVSPERDGSFIERDDVTLTCTGVNPPDALLRDLTFLWVGQLNYREDYVDLTRGDEGRGITVTTTGSTSTLSIMSIQDEIRIEGNYACRVFNRVFADVVEVTTEINVISGPLVTFPSGGDGPRVRQGDNLTVTCFTGGSDPPATFINITSGGQLLASVGDPIQGRLVFTITDASLADNGTVYVCTAVNDISTTSESFSLIVQDVPDKVDITTLNSDLLSLLVANISWTAPDYNNAPITSYNVSICKDIECFVENPAVPYLLFFVIPTYTYTINITATSGVGDSVISDEGMFMGAMETDSMATLITSLVIDSVVILEWTLPPLANIPDSIKPQTPEGEFDISGYFISILDIPNDPVFLAGRDNTNYLFSGGNGLSPGPERITISVTVNYSRAEINDLIPGVSLLSVDIPSPDDAIPDSAKAPAAATNVTEGFGFIISWNVPEVEPAFIEGYEVFINRADLRRRKRQEDPIRRPADVTSYTFTTDEAFTDFLVRVDGLLRVSGQRGRVPALIETCLRTSEGTSSPPVGLQLVGEAGVTSFNIQWSEPEMPNGVIRQYEVFVDGGNSRVSVDGHSAHVSGLRGHTEYTVSVYAINGAGDGELTPPLTVLTGAGVDPPNINLVSTNVVLRLYTLTIDGFEDDFGPLSHYVIYVVETDDPPDTSTIPDPNSDTAYIAIASSAAGRSVTFTEVIGDDRSGTLAVPGGNDVDFNNRAVGGGTKYFFVRLYSSVDVAVFNDSVPVFPFVILTDCSDPSLSVAECEMFTTDSTGMSTTDSTSSSNTAAIIGGVVAVILIIAVAFVIVAVAALVVLNRRCGQFPVTKTEEHKMTELPASTAMATTTNEAYEMMKHGEGVVGDYDYAVIDELPTGSPPPTSTEGDYENPLPPSDQPHPLPQATPTYSNVGGDGKELEAVYESIPGDK